MQTRSARPPLRPGDRPELTIESLVGGGEALARYEGYTVFVPYAVPGDRVRARVISAKPGYARALLEEVIAPGPNRVQPQCPAFARCGGCQWQGLDYAGQLDWKTRLVAEALERVGGLDPQGVLRPTLASPEPWHYRNKVHWAVAKQNGRWEIGLYEPRSHAIAEVPSCAIQNDALNRMLAAVRELLPRFDFAPYDEATGRGWLRSIFAKAGHASGETMLGLVTRTAAFAQEQAFVAAVREALPALTTLVQNVHPEAGNKLLGRETRALFGPGVIRERVGGLEYLISAQSFFQVNSSAIELLYEQVALACDLPSAPRVLDAYSGTGSIALYLAARGAKEVLGLEIVPAATRDAGENAARNGLAERARFVTGAVERELPKLVSNGLSVDVVVLDPPRKGCEPEVLTAVARMGVPKIVYVSCNPATLARDLKLLGEAGYRTVQVQPVDMFPQTAHVECCALLVSSAP
ncbi:MAG TPA: 23S rRNA (uracil(1939)-C(5))-methyltransferase RlmD [Oscillatoriaceae cyanobacterium]